MIGTVWEEHKTSIVAVVVALIALMSSMIVVPETEQAVVIRLGEPAAARPFGTDPAAPVLASLVEQGTLLPHLRTVAGSGLGDAIALLSGQAPNAQTLAGCPLYAAVAPATGVVGLLGVLIGSAWMAAGRIASTCGAASRRSWASRGCRAYRRGCQCAAGCR